MRFEGTAGYVATDDLKVAVNAAATLRRPLLIKGEPGTGKTVLAGEIARSFGAPLIEWNVKSTTKAQQGLYEYDAVSRLRDGQLGDARVRDISNYIRRGKMWEAFTCPALPVLLIDEIDKADIEFPNDLLTELDRMEFDVYETGERVVAAQRPIVIITSNNEKDLPDAFLRRCFFHYIKFPDRRRWSAIVAVHFPDITGQLVREALNIFYDIREVPGMKKKPSTSELLDWLKLLMHEDLPLDVLQSRDTKTLIPPLHGALLKNEQDVMLFERLAFMSRRQGGRAEVFLNFLTELRAAKIPASLKEHLTLLEALQADVIDFSVEQFYYLSRSCYVKDEGLLDRFDQVFGKVFKGIETVVDTGTAEIPEEWLRKVAELHLTEEEMAAIKKLGSWDEIMATLKKRLEEQKGRHEGGQQVDRHRRHLAVRGERL